MTYGLMAYDTAFEREDCPSVHEAMRLGSRVVTILNYMGQVLLGVLFATAHLHAQEPITFQYFYDDTDQLIKAVDSTGVVIEYVYDEVGTPSDASRPGFDSWHQVTCAC